MKVNISRFTSLIEQTELVPLSRGSFTPDSAAHDGNAAVTETQELPKIPQGRCSFEVLHGNESEIDLLGGNKQLILKRATESRSHLGEILDCTAANHCEWNGKQKASGTES